MADRNDVARKLREKYLHSMGSMLTREANLEEAMVFFQKAFDLEDTPYSWYGLSHALREAGDTAGAAGALSRAIKLAPRTPEYYHERAELLELLGRSDLAHDDMKKAVDLDRNYARIDTIRWALHVVDEALYGPVLPDGTTREGIHFAELGAFIDGLEDGRRAAREFMARPSCPVRSCPAYCCHFTSSLVVHGVTVGPWKLKAIGELLREAGLREEDYLETFLLKDAEDSQNLFSPQDIMMRGGEACVVYPARKNGTLGDEAARDIPKSRDYHTLMWIDGGARPCVFFNDGRCSVYDAGGDPGLDSCASFLCMTGLVCIVLKYLGLDDVEAMTTQPIAKLNDAAIEVLIILARDVYGTEGAIASWQAVTEGLSRALEVDRWNDEAMVRSTVERCRKLKEGHDRLIGDLMKTARQKIGGLLAAS